MVLSPLNVTLSHVNTVAKMTEVLRSVGGYEVPESLLKVSEDSLASDLLQTSGFELTCHLDSGSERRV